ncbi:reverse transcriptase family protein [Providencia sp. 21OH12SH02B-Prov]|uniref:reverse transcriptase family protein n=1 Tax=Providencia sp. 21OH12SH02B-Prov TaxID=3015951 RepID=UPI0022B6324C|nr:reverse transcriptase family protein [Providencia sp. 21OH12SH02B-Prov]WBA58573.1 reverse transcriptase family protein [Providencia sp. 21OH12SH02B-Prov]
MTSNKPISKSKKPILNLDVLSATLSIDKVELLRVDSLPSDKKYKQITLAKIDGSKRIVYSLSADLRKIQSRINKRIFRELIIWPDYLFGSVPNENDNDDSIRRDYVACAELHCGAKSILKVDIKDFFDHIHRDLVKQIFENVLNIHNDALELITNLCCKDDFIVQGALTSSYIATLCLFDQEHEIVTRTRRNGLVYTRLVDDITVSSKLSNFDFSHIQMHIDNMLASKDLPINKSKSKVTKVSMEPLTVHGLRVDFISPRVSSDEVKRIRASLHNLNMLAKKSNSRTSAAYRKEYNRCLGRINRLGRLGHNKYPIFLESIKKIIPLPSWRDVLKTKAALKSLESSYSKGNKNKSWYIRKYDLTYHRTAILNRSPAFNKLVIYIRNKLNGIKPDER